MPTGDAEPLYAVWKGFAGLKRLGVTRDTPCMIACETVGGGALRRALSLGVPVASVATRRTEA